MAGHILVPLKRCDRVEEIIPYLEKVAKPGMRVVFLVPYPIQLGSYYRDHWITTESPTKAMLEGRKIVERYSWELQRGLAEQRISSVREVLAPMGIEVTTDFYTGSLRRVVEDYCASRDVHLIMMKAGSDYPIVRLLSWISTGFGLFKRPRPAPVLLLHPNQGV